MREQIENLNAFITKYKSEFDKQLEIYEATELISWEDNTWQCGPQGVAWFRGNAKQVLVFNIIDGLKGLEKVQVDASYSDFMRAVLIMEIFCSSKIPSSAAIYKRLNILRRWYFEMVKLTGQKVPMYLSADVVHAAMKRHNDFSGSGSNVSDYCDLAVGLTKIIRPLNITLVPLICENKYPKRGTSVNTKARKAGESNSDKTDDAKLISIRTFMSIIEMIYLAKTKAEKLFLNFILLQIITGFRFQEAQSLKIDALIRRDIVDKNKLEHARDNGLPEYYLGIKYLGAKNAGWRTHWVAPSTNKLVESIFEAALNLTQESRKRLIQYRASNYTDFLPPDMNNEFKDGLIEISRCEGYLFDGTGGTRGHAGLRRSMMTALNAKGINIKPTSSEESNPTNKRFYYSKGQLNEFVKLHFAKNHAFHKGMECKLVITSEGTQHTINYEDLLFITPSGAFGLSKDLVVLTNPVPFIHSIIHAWLGGDDSRQSFFEKLGLEEEDGGRISIGTHFPRHNINTFLAIAGVTDHLQAMLMGRIDITQNQYYQHQAESFNYQAASMAVMALEENIKADKELSYDLTVTNTDTSNYQINAYANFVTSLDTIKKTNHLLIDPKLTPENNLKQNLHSVGESRPEIAKYISETMSPNFMAELKDAHDALISTSQNQLASELIERHAKLHALPMGSCTRDVAIWGCPFAMKCQNGEPCGYFTLTGRINEPQIVQEKLTEKKNLIIKLTALSKIDSSFEESLKTQLEALLLLESLHNQVITSLADRQLISIFSKDEANPLSQIVKRIQTQKSIGKTPKTLADMFFIEQKRMDRKSAIGVTNND